MTTGWHESWKAGRTGFHSDQVHTDLIEYEAQFLGGQAHRVLVPLCGKSVDLVWLAQHGHHAVGVELVPQAVEEFFEEQGIEATKETHADYCVYRSKGIDLFCGDMFKLDRDALGPIDRIWDRGALVALPEEMRSAYTKHLISLASDETLLLQNTFTYDQSVTSGPPFSISEEEVHEHFGFHQMELLYERDAIEQFPKFKAAGLSYWTVRSYLIQL